MKTARLTMLHREEYDLEQDAILEGQSRGLGLRGEWKDTTDWYGGRIEQIVRLSRSKGKFTYRLDRPDLKKSTRFARFLGSRRILKVKPSKDLRYEKGNSVREHLSGPFVLCGRVFVPFASKEGSAYMVEVNEDEDRKPDRAQGDHRRMSLWDFIEWHNPLGLNQKQVRVLRYLHVLSFLDFVRCSHCLNGQRVSILAFRRPSQSSNLSPEILNSSQTSVGASSA